MPHIDFWDNPAGYTGETYSPNVWESVTFYPDGSPSQTPGVCEVTAQSKRHVKPNQKAGSDGANPIFYGYDPSPVTIKITVWTPDQLNALTVLVDKLWKAPGKGPRNAQGNPVAKALVVYHPELAALRIHSVIVTDVSGLTHGSAKGSMTLTLTCTEYVKAKAHKKKSAVAKVQAVGSTLDNVNTPQPAPTPGSDSKTTDP